MLVEVIMPLEVRNFLRYFLGSKGFLFAEKYYTWQLKPHKYFLM